MSGASMSGAEEKVFLVKGGIVSLLLWVASLPKASLRWLGEI